MTLAIRAGLTIDRPTRNIHRDRDILFSLLITENRKRSQPTISEAFDHFAWMTLILAEP